MAITWFAVDCNIHTSPDSTNLSSALGLEVDAVVGKLCRLYGWAKLSGNETGDIEHLPDQEIADLMRWRKKPATLIKALYDCGIFEDVDGRRYINGWAKLNGKLCADKRKDTERKKGGNSTE